VAGVLTSCYSLQEQQAQSSSEKVDEMVSAEIAIAENLLNNGNAEKAWQNLRPLLEEYPERVEVLTLAGLSLLALQNNPRAQQLLQKAYRIKPTPIIGLNLSSAYIALGKHSQAKQLLLDLLERKVAYSFKERLWHNLALVYDQEGNESEAIATYQLAIKENPTYYLSHLHLAKIYSRQHETQAQALEYFARAHRFCPECYEPVEELARSYIAKNQTSEALALVQAYLQNEDNNGENRHRAQQLMHKIKTLPGELVPFAGR
jgi:tetratricopeptide (TPR) repeat protein